MKSIEFNRNRAFCSISVKGLSKHCHFSLTKVTGKKSQFSDIAKVVSQVSFKVLFWYKANN